MSIEILRSSGFRQGPWRNGLGISWEIASDGEGDDFGWRLALARIDGDVPFSAYPGIDRVFTLVEGDGLDLDVAGLGRLAVVEHFVPARFPGDAVCHCRLRHSVCTALNLFTRRGRFGAGVLIHRTDAPRKIGHDGLALLFVLQGEIMLEGLSLGPHDAARLTGATEFSPRGDAVVYEARLHAEAR